jgi:hypothetical protein
MPQAQLLRRLSAPTQSAPTGPTKHPVSLRLLMPRARLLRTSLQIHPPSCRRLHPAVSPFHFWSLSWLANNALPRENNAQSTPSAASTANAPDSVPGGGVDHSCFLSLHHHSRTYPYGPLLIIYIAHILRFTNPYCLLQTSSWASVWLSPCCLLAWIHFSRRLSRRSQVYDLLYNGSKRYGRGRVSHTCSQHYA